ncbi:TonB-dependent receptor [Vibrio sp. SCSIO 43135]|uniref:TonB-dependent receptor domain-containing protein n=1 Tax=Vibrio sp. SCSIO 43135 TaxID=2819096 RepID=UPI002076276C|nr:TonB-dependent receptor [Vibrio sp. SCSIO 43135]USD42898.1 TonB-dependent receptor [Vibrio sp. SCSIO 43135]
MNCFRLAPLGVFFLSFGAASVSANDETDEVMVVTATSYQKRVSEAPASVSVITEEELALLPYNNLADALVTTSGVNIADLGQGKKGIEIRGMDVSQSLILVNGRRLSGASDMMGHSNFELQNIPVSDIERIEIIKGPMSALYGSDALGGVVNVITKPTANEWSGSVRGGGAMTVDEDGNATNIEARASGALIDDKLLMKIAAGQTQQDLIENRYQAGETDIAGSKNKFVDVELKGIIDDRQEVDLGVKVGQSETWYDSVDRSSNVVRSTTTYDTLDYSLAHNGFWDFGDSQIRVYGTRVTQSNEKNIGEPNSGNDVDEDIVDGYLQFYAHDAHHMTIGGQWSEQRLKSTDLTSGGDSIDQTALFIQDDIELRNDLSLLLGLRHDDHSEFGGHTSPRAYLVYTPTKNWTLKGGYGEGFKAPTIKELAPDYYNTVPGRSFDIRGNADLKPEVNKSYELSAQYMSDRWDTTITLFDNNVENLIDLAYADTVDGREVREYVNVDEARIKGLEWSGNVTLSPAWFVNMNLTLLDTEDKSTGKALENKPESQAYVALNWQATDALITKVSMRHVGEQSYESRGTSYDLPSYQTYDLAANYKMKSFDISMGVSNLFDLYLEDESENFSYAILPRQVYLNGTYRF